MIEMEPMQSRYKDWQLRLVLFLFGQKAKDRLLYEGEPGDGLNKLFKRGSNRAAKARLERNDHRPIGDGAAPGEWREEDHPAEVAETLPP